MFDNNFGKCGSIFRILSSVDSHENSRSLSQRFPTHLQYVATLPSEIRNPKMLLNFYVEHDN